MANVKMLEAAVEELRHAEAQMGHSGDYTVRAEGRAAYVELSSKYEGLVTLPGIVARFIDGAHDLDVNNFVHVIKICEEGNTALTQIFADGVFRRTSFLLEKVEQGSTLRACDWVRMELCIRAAYASGKDLSALAVELRKRFGRDGRLSENMEGVVARCSGGATTVAETEQTSMSAALDAAIADDEAKPKKATKPKKKVVAKKKTKKANGKDDDSVAATA